MHLKIFQNFPTSVLLLDLWTGDLTASQTHCQVVEKLQWCNTPTWDYSSVSKHTISTSSTRSCLRHLTDTRCSLTSCSVSFLTVVLRQITTSTLTDEHKHMMHQPINIYIHHRDGKWLDLVCLKILHMFTYACIFP